MMETPNCADCSKAGERAEEIFDTGVYCSEAVLAAFEEESGHVFSDETRRAMVVMGEGFGTGCVCGALNAALFIIGALTGRDDDGSPKRVQKLARRFVADFKASFGSTCCKVITAKSAKLFGVGKFRHCPHITNLTTARLAEMVRDENLLPGD